MAEQVFFLARDGPGHVSNYIIGPTEPINSTPGDGATWESEMVESSLIEVCYEEFESIAETPEGDPFVLPRGAEPRRVKLRLVVEDVEA